MPAALKPRPFRLLDTCTKTCSLSAAQIGLKGAELVHGWYEQGCNNATIAERGKNIGIHVSEGAAGRHRANHLEALDTVDDADPTQGDDPPVGDIDFLNAVIAAGAKSLRFKTAKVSPDLAIKAMDLKYKLTQGNVFESFLAALGETMDEATAENPDARSSTDEQEQAAGDPA